MSYLSYWYQNSIVGWDIGGGIFEKIEFVTIFISAGLLGWKKAQKSWNGIEEFIMKWAFHVCWISFVISTVFVAPFIQHKDTTNLSSAVSDLIAVTNNLQKKIDQDETVIRTVGVVNGNGTGGDVYCSQIITNFDGMKIMLDNEPEPHSIQITYLSKVGNTLQFFDLPASVEETTHLEGRTIIFDGVTNQSQSPYNLRVDYFRKQDANSVSNIKRGEFVNPSVIYINDPNKEGLKPIDQTKPAEAYNDDGTKPLYHWSIQSKSWK